MFKDIVSRIPFSPALVGQLGFYARRLKKEEAVRRMGLIFTAAALVIQSFAVFTPPESANAASSNDMIYGGVSTKQQVLNAYDQNQRFRNVMNYVGVTRAELANTTLKTVNNLSYGTGSNAWKSWGWEKRFSAGQGEVKHNANGTTVFSRPHYLWNTTSYQNKYGRNVQVFHGYSEKLGEFGILLDCGNLFAPKLPSPPPPPAPPAPTPVATCTSLSAIRENPTTYRLRATASAKDGASISKYVFSIKTATATIKSFEYNSGNDGDITTGSFTLSPGTYTASVVVKTSIGDRTSTSCVTKITVPRPGVVIEKTIDGNESKQVNINQEYTYNVAIKNTGDTPLEMVTVTDEAPRGISLLSASSGTVTDDTWRATIQRLEVNETKSYTIKAIVRAYVPGVLKNTACVETASIPSSNPDDCDDATVTVVEPTIKVCELATDRIIVIKQSDFTKLRHSKNLADCTKLQVCDTASGTIITIREPEFDQNKHTKDLSMCDDMQVCDLTTGEVITIKVASYDETKHSKDASDCVEKVASHKKATNLSQGQVDATTVTAQAGDRIEYTVRLHNVGSVSTETTFVEELKDVLEYSRLTDNGGGIFNEEEGVLSWGDITLAADEHTSRSFTVTLLDTIPQTARGTSDPGSFDCILTNTFGNSVDVTVDCGAAKDVEAAVTQLPSTGPTENMLFAGVVGAVVIYFYARSRQLATEVRLIRRDINAGTL